MAPDEIPNLLDLHLLLGHAFILAHPHKESLGAVSVDSMLGWVPQSMVDDEDSVLWNTLEVSLQLWGLGCVADNAQQQYVKLAAFALSGVHQAGQGAGPCTAGPAPPLQLQLQGGGASVAETGGQHQPVSSLRSTPTPGT